MTATSNKDIVWVPTYEGTLGIGWRQATQGDDDGVFELVDTNEDDDGDIDVEDALQDAADAIGTLVDAVRSADKNVVFELGNVKSLSSRQLAAIAAACLSGDAGSHEIEMSNRKHCRKWNATPCGYASLDFRGSDGITNALYDLFDTMLNKCMVYNKRDVPHWISKYDEWKHRITFGREDRNVELRTCVVALNLLGDMNWRRFRDDDDPSFDDMGILHVAKKDDNDDKVEEIMHSPEWRSCSACGEKHESGIQIGKYIELCSTCAKRIADYAYENGIVKSVSEDESARIRSAMEELASAIEESNVLGK